MAAGSIARRYARALMSIGVDRGTYEALGREVDSLAQAMHISDELTDVLSNPAFPSADRRKILDALLTRLGASATTKNFVNLLLDQERLAALPDIARELAAMIDERAGRVKAQVTSATALTSTQLGQLRTTLEKLSGKQVEIEAHQDPELLGGVIAKVGDIVYDGSLRTQLENMRHGLGD